MPEHVNTHTVVHVKLGARSYPIYIGSGVLAQAGALIAPLLPQPKAIIITDSEAGSRYGQALIRQLHAHGITCQMITLPNGEASKSFSMFAPLMEMLLAYQPDRKTTLIALGGGVVGDITGFAASILLRGVPFVQIPTTLLSQVDSSVGGKTAINSLSGKNLIGSFHQPRAVLADSDTLTTLPHREWLAGYAEVIKYGLINDLKFFDWLCEHAPTMLKGDMLKGDMELLAQAVAHSCRAKAAVVAADEHETGDRALLNFGHTFGHALEKETGYSSALLHGEAVALGSLMALSLSIQRGLCPQDHLHQLQQHFLHIGMPTHLRDVVHPDSTHIWDARRLTQHCYQDKKAHSGNLTFILCHGIGKAFVAKDVQAEEVTATFREFGAC